MNIRKFSELIFTLSVSFIDSNFDIRICDGEYSQLATVSEHGDSYIVTAYFPVHNPIYNRLYCVTGEHALFFKLCTEIRVRKSIMVMSLFQGMSISEESLAGLVNEADPACVMNCPPSNLNPDGNNISLTVNFKSSRGGMNLVKAVCTVPKNVGDEWCELLYRWATQ